jgi:hypothetical protein
MKEKIKQVNELCAANGSYINQHGKKQYQLGQRLNTLEKCLALSLVYIV